MDFSVSEFREIHNSNIQFYTFLYILTLISNKSLSKLTFNDKKCISKSIFV